MLKEIYKRVIIVSLAIFMASFIARMFIAFSILDFAIGIAAGMLVTIIRFKMLSNSINKLADMPKEIATKMGVTGYITRYIFTGICLIIAVLYKLDTFIALAITLVLATQIAARTIKVTDDITENKKKEV